MNKGFLDFASDFEKQNIFKIVCSMAVCYIFVNLVIYFADTFFCTGVQPYMTAHHFLNYHFGIIPRALYGATIGELTQVLPKAAYFLVWFLICVIPYVVYFCVYLRMRKSSRNVNTLDAVAFFAADGIIHHAPRDIKISVNGGDAEVDEKTELCRLIEPFSAGVCCALKMNVAACFGVTDDRVLVGYDFVFGHNCLLESIFLLILSCGNVFVNME